MAVDRKDLGAGAAFIGVAAIYGGIAWISLPIGQALSMGPGYFPLVLSILIGIIGVILVARSFFSAHAERFFDAFSWRGVLLLNLALIIFGAFVRELGLFVSVLVAVALCALAGRMAKPMETALLALGLAVLCTLVFGYGVRLPIPIRGSWLGG